MTIAPCLVAMGTNSLETSAPAEKKQKSTPLKSKDCNSTMGIFSSRKLTSLPRERALARGTILSRGKFLSSNIEMIVSPTNPVAPTTTTLYPDMILQQSIAIKF